MTYKTAWTDEHSAALSKMMESRSGSFADYANRLNKMFGTSYSRNAAIGRAMRMGFRNPNPPPSPMPSTKGVDRIRERHRQKAEQRRLERWATDLSLKQRYLRTQEKRNNCKIMLAGGATKTSAQYRKHLPHVQEMTKNELRAMLTAAVQNTAAMVSP